MKPDTIKSLLILAAAGGAAFVVYRTYKGATGWLGETADAIGYGVQNFGASVTQAWNNATTVQVPGDPVRAALYSDKGYAGLDETGQSPLTGEWFGSEEGRRYSYQYRDAAIAAGRPAPVESSNGAAFGIYPSAARRQVAPPVDETIADRWDYYTVGSRGAGSGSGTADERSFDELSQPGGHWYYP